MDKHLDIDILESNFYWGADGRDQVREIIIPETYEQVISCLSITCCIFNPISVYRYERFMPYGP